MRMDIWLKIFLTFAISYEVKMKRLVMNTTCLELAKPSNQQFRLTCSQYHYHCLLDETFTKEFEICRQWKWIPEGKCAYFNTYGEGNIDGRPCISSTNLFCPNAQYSSAENTNYSACYVKQNTGTMAPTTSDKWSKKKNSSAEKSDDRIAEQQLLIYVRNNKPEDRPNMMNGSEDYSTVVENEDGNNEEKNSADTSNIPLESKKLENGDVTIDAMDECKKSSAQITKQTVIIFDEKEDDKESTDVFDDTVESLRRIAPPTDEQETQLCTELFNLLAVEGLKLSQEVMATIITSMTEKSVKELVADENVLNKLISDKALPKEYYWSIENEKCKNSSIIHILHSLLKMHLKANCHPKSGWGNPVRRTDVSIGDDIERLNRIYIIFREISKPVTVSVESYIRLLDIMIEALTRLDPDAEFKEDFKALVGKLTRIEIPTLTQTVVKKVLGFINFLSYNSDKENRLL